MDDKPRLYITRDAEGIFLWFGVDRPAFHQRNKRFRALAERLRLPVSLYGEKIGIGEMRAFDPDAMLA